MKNSPPYELLSLFFVTRVSRIRVGMNGGAYYICEFLLSFSNVNLRSFEENARLSRQISRLKTVNGSSNSTARFVSFSFWHDHWIISIITMRSHFYRAVTYLQDSTKCWSRTGDLDLLYSTRREKHYVTSSLFTVTVLVKRLDYIS